MELQRAADRKDMKGFYSGLKEVWDPKKKALVRLKSTDGMETFSDSKRVVARLSEYFQKLLNVPGDIAHEFLQKHGSKEETICSADCMSSSTV